MNNTRWKGRTRRLLLAFGMIAMILVSACQEDDPKKPAPPPPPPPPPPGPEVLTIDTAFDGTVEAGKVTLHTFTTPSLATVYIISLTGSGSNLAWGIFADEELLEMVQVCNFSSLAEDEICLTPVLSADTAYYLVVEEKDEIDATYTLLVSNIPALTIGQSLLNESIDANGSNYYSLTTGATPAIHTISLIDTGSDLTWSLYADAGFSDRIYYCDGFNYAIDEVCVTQELAADTMYYLVVDEWDNQAGSFSLLVEEGSIYNPVFSTLTVGTPSDELIDEYGLNHYEFTTGAADAVYTISLTNTNSDLNWELFANAELSLWMDECDTSLVAEDEICVTPLLAANTTYYLRVSEWDFVLGGFTILVEEGNVFTPEYTAINIDETIGNLTIPAWGISFYQFTTGPADTPYSIHLTGADSNISWAIFADADLTQFLSICNDSHLAEDEHCYTPMLLASTTYYLVIQEQDMVDNIYSLLVETGDTITPVLNFGNQLVGESIEASAIRVYQFTSAAVEKSYTARLTAAGSNLSWVLYSDNTADPSTLLVTCNTNYLVVDEICVMPELPANRVHYLLVYEYGGVAGTYDLVLEEGDTLNPALTPGVQVDNEDITYNGTNIYQFTTGAADGYHTIWLTNLIRKMHWELYPNPLLTNMLQNCNNYTLVGEEICVTPMLTANTTYYLKVKQDQNALGTYSILVQPEPTLDTSLIVGSNAAGENIAADGRQMYRFTTGGVDKGHTISLTLTGSDLSWELHAGPGIIAPLASCDAVAAQGDEICLTPVLTADTEYFILVREKGSAAGTFTLRVEQGDSINPALTVDTAVVGESIAASGQKLYRLPTGGTDSVHTIRLTATGSDLSWRLFSDPLLITTVTTCDTVAAQGDEICLTPVLTANRDYYLRVTEKSAVAGTFDLLVELGDTTGP
ncbi:MAG: hypothetical protein OEZ59_10415 [Deltaproteobacteria bacterium]|nr:hypothetical protein [Deltaproteobacteria bacterium]